MDIVTWNTVRDFRFKMAKECCLQRKGHNGHSGHSCLGNFDTALLAIYLLIKLINKDPCYIGLGVVLNLFMFENTFGKEVWRVLTSHCNICVQQQCECSHLVRL